MLCYKYRKNFLFKYPVTYTSGQLLSSNIQKILSDEGVVQRLSHHAFTGIQINPIKD